MNKRNRKKARLLEEGYKDIKELTDIQQDMINGLHRDIGSLSRAVSDYTQLMLRLPLLSPWSTFKSQPDGKYIIYWQDKERQPHCRLVDKRGDSLYMNERADIFPLEKIKPAAYLQIPAFPQLKRRR